MTVYQDLHDLYNLVFREFQETEKKTGRGVRRGGNLHPQKEKRKEGGRMTVAAVALFSGH